MPTYAELKQHIRALEQEARRLQKVAILEIQQLMAEYQISWKDLRAPKKGQAHSAALREVPEMLEDNRAQAEETEAEVTEAQPVAKKTRTARRQQASDAAVATESEEASVEAKPKKAKKPRTKDATQEGGGEEADAETSAKPKRKKTPKPKEGAQQEIADASNGSGE